MKFLRNAFLLFATVVISSCGGGGGDDPAPTPAPSLYKVGGSVSGLTGSLTLQNNGGESLSLTADGGFTFLTTFNDSANYSVSVATQPTGQACSITSGSGTFNGADITNVDVSCVDLASYNLGGSVTGLTGTVVLRNNGGDNLSVSANGGFIFATPVYDTTNYSVSVLTQPTGQVCSVSNGAGTVSGAAITSVSVSCVTAYTIGGSVSGLTGTVVLQNNNGNNLTRSANGGFSFSTAILNATNYSVSVLTQPTGQICSVSNGSGTVNGSNITTVAVSCVDIPTYSIGGSVSGLTGTVTLQNNGGDNLALSANGGFTFATAIYDNTSYNVSVSTQPTGQICTVTNGVGTLSGAAVTTVAVSCADIPTYSIGGSVSGLTGTVVLQNNSGDDLTLSANGSFTFATSLNDTTTYNVSVLTQPGAQTCNVTNGVGTLSGAAVTTVAVTCADIPQYSIGGTVTGLSGGINLDLTSGTGVTERLLTGAGDFTFTTTLPDLDTYNVTIFSAQVGYTCSISSESGTVVGANVTNINVSCSQLHKIGGTVSGLTGSLTLTHNINGTESGIKNISADGVFEFGSSPVDSDVYDVSVDTHPVNQVCVVNNGSGTVSGADVNNINVICSDAYTVGGSVTGLSGSLELKINGGDPLTVNTDGAITFATPLLDSSNYAVTIATQPSNQFCAVTNATGTITSASVTNVSVSCSNTFSVGGSITGLTGPLTLKNNSGDELSLTTNGAYSFPATLLTGATYSISVASKPASYACTVSNGTGSINGASVTNVDINCSAYNIALNGLGIVTNSPSSVVVMPVHASDVTTGRSISGLLTDDFNVLQDSSPVGVESFVDSKPIGDVNYTFRTVVVMDISSSIEPVNDFPLAKAAVQYLVDNLQPNQELAIYTFDETVTPVQGFTSDKDALTMAVDGITRGVSSTNLHGAIIQAAGIMNDVFTLDSVVYNSMIVITDGEDTSALYSQAAAKNSVLNKKVFALPVGAAYTPGSLLYSSLIDIFGENQILATSDFNDLNNQLNTARDELLEYFKGLYYVYYASPARTGTHTIDLSIVGNNNSGLDSTVSGQFSASGFTSVTPEVMITGDVSLESSTISWSVETQWSNDPANYSWATVDGTGAVIDVSDVLTLAVTGDSSTATLTNTGGLEGLVRIKVTDLWNNAFLTKTLDVFVDTDSDGVRNSLDTDDDNDGVLDGSDAFPFDKTETLDTDGDGIGNNTDADDDADGVLDLNDAFPLDATETLDTDGDGIGNNTDTDIDGDGVLNGSDPFPLDGTETLDTDGDGIGNNTDTDDDADGVLDINDAFPLDATETLDTDGDGIGNNTDTDIDGDGVLNGSDAFPLDATETLDTDGDGIGNNTDTDDDGDGVLDVKDFVPLDPAKFKRDILNLSALNGNNGFVLKGINAGDYSGVSVSDAGDVNGDGVGDLIIGANGGGAGRSYVVFGSNAAWSASLDLSTLDGSNGFVLNGIDAGDSTGFSVSAAGDINGDGLGDLIIGANAADPNGLSGAGESYVVFGSNATWPASVNLSTLNGNNGFVLNGIDLGDFSGRSVSAAGDINGDGLSDVIIGAFSADPNGKTDAGESYVVFGSNAAWPASMNLSSLDGSNGFVLNGIDTYTHTRSGISVSAAGDINGDGLGDLIIGANLADPNGKTDAGESYVVFGSNAAWPASMNLSSLNGSNGFVLNGVDINDYSGSSVSAAGDINGDGLGDLIIGAYVAGQIDAGKSYVVFGSNAAWPASMNLSSLNGSNGFVLNGFDTNDQSGYSVSAAGDINGDGLGDLIIGALWAAPNATTGAGKSYVVFGSNEAWSAGMSLFALDGSNGFVLNGIDINDHSGNSVSSAGDVNGDGFADLIIGAFTADPNGQADAGESYVVFGCNYTELNYCQK